MLGNPREIQALQNLIQMEDPDIIFIMEMKSSFFHMEMLKFQLGFSCFLAVASVGRSGGLCLHWNKEVNLVLHSFSKFYFDMFVTDSITDSNWRLFAIYGHPDTSRRNET